MKEGRRDADVLKAKVNAGSARTTILETEPRRCGGRATNLAMNLPNLLDDRVPTGTSEADNVVVRTWGTPRCEAGAGDSHVEIGTARIRPRAPHRGHRPRFCAARRRAKLERALINFFPRRAHRRPRLHRGHGESRTRPPAHSPRDRAAAEVRGIRPAR